jgi:hypothetical protein
MAFVRPSALSLGVVLWMSACSPTVQTLREMPATGTIQNGRIVYVDDGDCPLGQVKEVTGGSLTQGIPRGIRCVDRPSATAPTVTPERRSESARRPRPVCGSTRPSKVTRWTGSAT